MAPADATPSGRPLRAVTAPEGEVAPRTNAIVVRDEIARGALSAVAATRACLDRIAAREDVVQAWAHLDPAHALRQAERLDALRKSGRPIGPLHGVPVGIKDIIDTADMATENGTPIDEGRRPERDATVVARLRAAGAVILGKTVTTELAYFAPGKTRHPQDPDRTPGGSSSGSAAAVADGMVPLAVGTQTTGSVIRPGAFCGVTAFKPSHGLIPRSGILSQAPELDTVGVFAADISGAALITDVLAGYDPADPDTVPSAAPRLFDAALRRPPVRPRLAFVRSPAWDLAEPSTREAFAELVEVLGDDCDTVDLPEIFAEAAPAQRTLMQVGIARNLGRYLDRAPESVSPQMCEAIEAGRAVRAVDYLSARDWRKVLNDGIEQVFERYDAIVTPAARGEAPGRETTGDPSFCAMWTLLGTPALSLPLMTGPSGLPLGAQVVGRRGVDARLLTTAAWLVERLSANGKLTED